MSGKLRYEIEIGGLGTSIYGLKKMQKALFDVGETGKKSFRQLELEQRAIVAQLSGQKVHHMPSDEDLRTQSQSMLSKASIIPYGPVPPVIPGGGGGAKFSPQDARNLSMAMAPLMNPTSMFSQLIGFRGAFGLTQGKAGQSALGAMGLGGSTAVAAGVAATAVAALAVAGLAAKVALEEMSKALKDGLKLFTEAADLHRRPGEVMQAKTILESLGLNNTPQNMRSAMNGGVPGGAADYVRKLTQEDKKFWDSFAVDARDFHVVWGVFQYKLELFGAKIADTLLPALTALVNLMNHIPAKLIDIGLSAILAQIPGGGALYDLSKTKEQAGNKGRFGDAQAPPRNLSNNRMSVSSLERMGLIVGYGGSGQDYAKQTATNTKETAKATNKMAQLFTKMNGGGASPMSYYMTAGINAY